MKLSEMSVYHGHNKKNADRTVNMSIFPTNSFPLVLFPPDLYLFVQLLSHYFTATDIYPYPIGFTPRYA